MQYKDITSCHGQMYKYASVFEEDYEREVHLFLVGFLFINIDNLIGTDNFIVIMPGNDDYKAAKSIYDFTAKTIKGEEISLSEYKGHVCLIINVASNCGLAETNYKELNELFDQYGESKGLRILAFPCNQFLGKEPGDATKICLFTDNHKVKFDVFEKIEVNGEAGHPLWKYLKKEQGGILGNFIKWNFTKFIVDKEGKVVERHGPNVDPNQIASHLEKYF